MEIFKLKLVVLNFKFLFLNIFLSIFPTDAKILSFISLISLAWQPRP